MVYVSKLIIPHQLIFKVIRSFPSLHQLAPIQQHKIGRGSASPCFIYHLSLIIHEKCWKCRDPGAPYSSNPSIHQLQLLLKPLHLISPSSPWTWRWILITGDATGTGEETAASLFHLGWLMEDAKISYCVEGDAWVFVSMFLGVRWIQDCMDTF